MDFLVEIANKLVSVASHDYSQVIEHN